MRDINLCRHLVEMELGAASSHPSIVEIKEDLARFAQSWHGDLLSLSLALKIFAKMAMESKEPGGARRAVCAAMQPVSYGPIRDLGETR